MLVTETFRLLENGKKEVSERKLEAEVRDDYHSGTREGA